LHFILESSDEEIISMNELQAAGYIPDVNTPDNSDIESEGDQDNIEQMETADSHTGDSQTGDSQTGDSQTGDSQTGDSQEPSTMSPQNKKRKGGRHKDEVWSNFENVIGTKRDWKCKHCSKLFKCTQADRLKKHIDKSCEVLKKLKRIQSKKDKAVVKVVSAPGSPVSVPTSMSANEKIEENSIPTKQQSIRDFYPKTSIAMQNRINVALMKFICATNVPFSLVENQYFHELLRELRPSYAVPSAKSVSGLLLNSLYEEEKSKLKNKVKGSKAVIIHDGWSTNQSEAVIAHALSIQDKVEFLNACVVEEEKKTALTCLRFVKEAIQQATESFEVNIVGLVTDNCNTMVAMRRQFALEFPNMITYGCNSHLLNLIGKKLTPEELKIKIVKVQKFFRNHDLPASYLKKLGGNRPIIPGDTRWNSHMECFSSYIKNQAKYLEISRKADIDMPTEIKVTLKDEKIFEELENALKILTPVAVALDKVSCNCKWH